MSICSSPSPTSSMAQKFAHYCALKGLLAPDDSEEGQDATWTRLDQAAHEIIGMRCGSPAECLLKIGVMLDRVDEADHETRQMLQSLHRDLSGLPQSLSQ